MPDYGYYDLYPSDYYDVGVDLGTGTTINFNDMPYSMYYGPIGDSTSLGGDSSSVLSSLLGGLIKAGGSALMSDAQSPGTAAMEYKPKYQTAAEKELLNLYRDLIARATAMANQPAMPGWVEPWLTQQMAPLLATGGITSEDKVRQALLKSLSDMGMQDFYLGDEYYDQARAELEKIAGGIDLADVSPGFRGTEWEQAMQDYIDSHAAIRQKTADTYINQGQDKQQALAALLNMQEAVTGKNVKEYGSAGTTSRLSNILGTAMIPTLAKQEWEKSNLNTIGNLLSGYSTTARGITPTTIPATAGSTNTWESILGQALAGAGTQLATTPAAGSILNDLFGGIFG